MAREPTVTMDTQSMPRPRGTQRKNRLPGSGPSCMGGNYSSSARGRAAVAADRRMHPVLSAPNVMATPHGLSAFVGRRDDTAREAPRGHGRGWARRKSPKRVDVRRDSKDLAPPESHSSRNAGRASRATDGAHLVVYHCREGRVS